MGRDVAGLGWIDEEWPRPLDPLFIAWGHVKGRKGTRNQPVSIFNLLPEYGAECAVMVAGSLGVSGAGVTVIGGRSTRGKEGYFGQWGEEKTRWRLEGQ